MIKIKCDLCKKKISYFKDICISSGVEVDMDGSETRHTTMEESLPTPYNLTFCSPCYYSMEDYFNNFNNFNREVENV